MSDIVEICPQCGKIFSEKFEKCSECGSSFDLTEIKTRREDWLKHRKKDGFLTMALKTVAEADFSQIDSALVQAVLRCGDFEALKKVVASGYDNWNVPELLMAAIKAPFPEIMTFLKRTGVDFDRFFADLTAGKLYMSDDLSAPPKKIDKKTASERLRKAIESGSLKKAEYWLQNGADVNYCPYTEKDIDPQKHIWYMHTLPMISQARSLKMAQLLVAHGAKLNDWRILYYMTEYSCCKVDLIQFLVENGAKYCLDKPERNLLATSASDGDLKKFKYIHSLGFDINTGMNTFLFRKNPLRLAVEHGHNDILRYLLENGAKTNIDNKKDDLFNNIGGNETDFLKCLNVLLEFNIDIGRCCLLETAAKKGMLKAAKFLLDHGCPVETYSQDEKRVINFPLLWCVDYDSENKLEMIDLLVSYGASINGIWQYNGSPLREAVTKLEPATVEKLLQHGADPNLQDNKMRELLLDVLYQKPQTKVLKIVKLLVEHGANTKVTFLNSTLLQIARERELPKVVEYFKEIGLKR